MLIRCCLWGEDRWVVQVPQDAAGWARGRVVAVCEEIFFDLGVVRLPVLVYFDTNLSGLGLFY